MQGIFGTVTRKCIRALSPGLEITRNVAKIPSVHAVPSIRTKPPVINHSIEMSNLRKRLLPRPGLLGIKRGMITWFTDEGEQFASTVVEIDSCEVIGHKTHETHGYNSVVLGLVDKMKNISEKNLRMFEEAGVSPKKKTGEFRIRDEKGFVPVGVELRADYFCVGQLVDVKGITKGKGFAGVMKRHGFKGLKASHGVSKAHRSAGSMGPSQDPGRILPGKKMAGHMGVKNCTVCNNQVLYVDAEAGILVIKGQIPGPNKGFVKVTDAKKLYGKSLI